MATLVLTTLGSALGGPIGGALGGLVGQSIDHGLFGQGMRKGPRLGDLSVQTSSYGSPIPRIYGTMRVAGTVVWATDLQEEEVIEGGGKGSPERLSYSYSANLAVAISSRPIKDVRRIWADGKLIRGAAGDFKVKTGFRLCLGDDDQPIDPLVASIEGIDFTPAYRGVALAIFEDLDLTEFGNRIPQFSMEVIADEGAVPLSSLLADASGGLIDASNAMPISGYAAHGDSIAGSLEVLVELSGIVLAERSGQLLASINSHPLVIPVCELGCDADAEKRASKEQQRAPDSAMPASIAMTFYDPERDYQFGQVRASSGNGGTRDERIELPAALTASEARQLVESGLARRWLTADELRLRLPPTRIGLEPGDAIQIEGTTRARIVRSASVEGLAVVVETAAAPVTIQPLPADAGRAASEPDEPVGRSNLALFELPPDGDSPAESPRVFLAASSDGLWKSIPVEPSLNQDALTWQDIRRRSIIGHAVTVLEPRCPMVVDEQSTVIVQLVNHRQILLNADWDALVAGSNLAVIGDELIQFCRAEPLGPGLFRLSRLLRGRRGTEWASMGHAVGEVFCLIERAAVRLVDLATSSVGSMLTVIAHGVGDTGPLPEVTRLISGEAMRPPSPCHLRTARSGSDVTVSWVRRSHRKWAWVDAIGDTADNYPELYRLTVQGPSGQLTAAAESPSFTFNLSAVAGESAQSVDLSIETIGPAALSRPATATIVI